MKRPHVTCHMLGTLDGRTLGKNWGLKHASRYFEGPASKIKVDAWIVGRVTMQEFASHELTRPRAGKFAPIPRTDFKGKHKAKTYCVAIDPSGKCRWDTNMVTTEHVIEVLTEKVTDEYLDHLRERQVSYIFGGKTELDLELVLLKLRQLFGIKKVRVDGGGHVNGSFLRAGLIDEMSLVLAPLADGTVGSTSVFEVEPDVPGRKATRFRLKKIVKLGKGFLWLRYKK